MNRRITVIIVLCVSIIVLIVLAVYTSSKALIFKDSTNRTNVSATIVVAGQDLLNALHEQHVSYRKYVRAPDLASSSEELKADKILFEKKLSLLRRFPLSPDQFLLLDSIHNLHQSEIRIAAENLLSDSAALYTQMLNENYRYSKLKYLVTSLINNEKSNQFANVTVEDKDFGNVITVVILSASIAVLIIIFTVFYILRIYRKLTTVQSLLHKSQERLESIIEELPIGIIIANLGNNRYHANKKAIRLSGNSVESDGSMHFEGGTSSEDMKNLFSSILITNAIDGQKSIGIDTVLTINGKELPIRVSSIPLYNEKNKIEQAIAVFDDITDTKMVEAELKEANILIEESLKLKEIFLTNMSHEIRTPMNAILGFAELLSKKPLGKKENEYVKTILTAGNSLLRILDDILDFSKLNAKMMIFEEKSVDIKETLENIKNLYTQKAESKRIHLTYHHDENINTRVITDPVRLTQVITNIVGNAIKFTEKGSISISSKALSQDGGIIDVEFKIADTGIGIPPNKLRNIFQRFEQVFDGGKYGGTGLGLSIAKHIVELQGGKISVESEQGNGSLFTFNFPFKKYKEDVEVKPVKNPHPDENLKAGIVRILLVEDNEYNISLAKGIFSNYTVDLDIAENGKSARQQLTSKEYDLLLMDIELPDAKGYDLCREARENMNLKIPVVALTAHAMAAEREKCIAAGMNDYLTKPIKTELLLEKISKLTGYKLQPIAKDNDDITITPNPATQLINLDYLHDVSGNNPEFEKEILAIFIEQASGQLDILKNALSHRDVEKLSASLHTLKSLVAMFFDGQLAENIDSIYAEITSGNFSEDVIEKCNNITPALNAGIKEARLIHQRYSELNFVYN